MEFHWQPVWVSRGRFVATQLQQIMAAVAERVHDDEPAGDVRVVPSSNCCQFWTLEDHEEKC